MVNAWFECILNCSKQVWIPVSFWRPHIYSIDTSPNGERVVQFTLNDCFLQSKLWTNCSYTGLRLSVSGDTKTLNYSVFNDLETIKGHYFRFAYDNTADLTAGGMICTKSLNLIRQEFPSENYIYIQEYCTDTSGCGSQLATSFGDRIRMDLVPVNSGIILTTLRA